ncbi:MAG: hypothetical protein ACR2OU_00070 [Thermomicrobiales bacterium]
MKRRPPHPDIPQVQSTPFAIIPVQSEEEAVYESLLLAIDSRSSRLNDLDSEIAPLLRALEKFEWQYNSQLGDLQRELRHLRSQVETIEHRTARIHARTVADPNHIMGDLFNEEELREIGELFGVQLPESWFESAREVEDRRRQQHADDDDWENDPVEEEILRRLNRNRLQRKRLPEDIEQELRSLHRSLARRFHPDLASTEAERVVCQEMMLRINAAWHEQDLNELRKLDKQSDHLDTTSSQEGFVRRIHWARQECMRLDEQLDALVHKLTSLRESNTFPLWFNPTLAQTVITQRASALRLDLATEERRMEEMKLAFRHALATYAVTVS